MNNELKINKVGIVGQGKMGAGIFHYLLDFQLDLVWVCSPQADTDKLIRQFAKRVKRSLDAGIIDNLRFETLTGTVITKDPAALHDCDLVIEALPENLELKKRLFLQLDEIVKPEAIFASNSSSINPSEIAPEGRRAGQFTGLHFFYPVSIKNIVEFTYSENTTAETIAAVGSFLNRIDRRYIKLDAKNSFILNRIFLDVQNEALIIVNSGNCSYLQMDHLVKDNLFPFGVFDFCDSVGLDTMLSSILNYTRSYPDKLHYSLMIETLSALVAQGRLGIKTQSGFFDYPAEAFTGEAPANADEIIDHLRETWQSSAMRMTVSANISAEDANFAIMEYFDITTGPFE